MRPVIPNWWLEQAPLVCRISQAGCHCEPYRSGVTGIEYYQIDLGIAMEHMVSGKATELGLGNCWIGRA